MKWVCLYSLVCQQGFKVNGDMLILKANVGQQIYLSYHLACDRSHSFYIYPTF